MAKGDFLKSCRKYNIAKKNIIIRFKDDKNLVYKVLHDYNLSQSDYEFISKSKDNIVVEHKITKKILNLRY